ncbi:MAG: hypothetical protein EOO27_39190 [Comamonadaceae bacterium]|nr:MAG: hypothetical protein EOO27_39190 [Comamonadaceae bacterium]
MMFVGIDPGLTGACAVVGPQGLRGVFDLPTMPIPGVGPKAMVQRKIDGRAFCNELLRLCPAGEAKPTIVIEAVGTMGGANNAVQTQGSLLRSLGALETVAECLRLPVLYVSPQTWKRRYGLIDSKLSLKDRKAKAMDAARSCFPACTDIARAKDHNRAEAILIARYAQLEMA